MTKVGENVPTEFLDVLFEWETAIVEELRKNRPMKSKIAQKREEYGNATICYICCHAFEKDDPKGPKVCDHDDITGFLLGAAHQQ